MNGRSRIILIACSVGVSLSVMAMARDHGIEVIQSSDHAKFDVSKIEPFRPSTFVLKNYDCSDMINYELTFERGYTIIAYNEGKVNNKALPLCKKLWLLHCQFALK